MDFLELIFTLLGAAVVVYYGGKLLLFSRMLFPKWCFPLSKTFFTSMGEWAVVTGASEGIGRAYAFALADRGMNVVIMSRTKAMLEKVAEEIGETTGRRVKVIVADFSDENVFGEIEEELKDLNIGVLVNNIGVLPTFIPCKFLDSEELDKTITKVINCNVKTLCQMCKIILPGMENRNKGVIINVASGIASFPFPLYTLYAASKVFVERFSQGLQAEYKDRGIIIQAVAPFGVSTRMAGFQKTNIVTLLPEDFVQKSLQYVRAGDKINGTICHTLLAWLLQSIPLKLFYAEFVLQGLQDYVKKKTGQRESVSESKMES
ncbi:17-beta-hydroxysteroid dehydrogenase type 3 isoform X2 [Poeciliopsis prolifica]|uniref:17-beta-hydroxysteroid dehydrogenase type 3 isoform X2 n=1 Tax=Poeciliopsis prolifica TaxID=188132 RepID=UPI002412F135|nr:17-beta-hydroxysteroid dehydrogenase type 3 isoform X2 [Poeciliopsis prolifica]